MREPDDVADRLGVDELVEVGDPEVDIECDGVADCELDATIMTRRTKLFPESACKKKLVTLFEYRINHKY